MHARWKTPRAVLVGMLALAAIAGAERAIAASTPQPVAVSIVGRAYLPAQTTVGLGQTVTWSNGTLDKHTVTSVEGLFNSGVMTTGQSFSVTFTKAGTFDYKCTVHPTMHGSVLVLPIAAGTVLVRVTERHRALIVHVQAARTHARVLLQASVGGRWQTVSRSRLGSTGRALLTLAGAGRRRLRVVVLGGEGAARLVSRVVRTPA